MYCLTVQEAGSRDQSVTRVDSLRAEEKKNNNTILCLSKLLVVDFLGCRCFLGLQMHSPKLLLHVLWHGPCTCSVFRSKRAFF